MQVNYPGSGQIAIMIWFALSVLVEIVSGIMLWFWLRRQGVKLSYLMVKMPGNMEAAYVKWCRSQGRAPNKKVLVFRAVSLINAIIAGILFIVLVATR